MQSLSVWCCPTALIRSTIILKALTSPVLLITAISSFIQGCPIQPTAFNPEACFEAAKCLASLLSYPDRRQEYAGALQVP